MQESFTIFTTILGAGLGLILKSAGQAFNLLFDDWSWHKGLIYILRWFWWRINAYTENCCNDKFDDYCFIFKFGGFQMPDWVKVTIGASLTTIIWVLATFITPQDDESTLRNFVNKVNPGGPGWKNFPPSMESKLGLFQKVFFQWF